MADIEILKKILGIAERLEKRCSGTSKEDFINDIDSTEIAAFNLEQLGEYVKRLDNKVLTLYNDIPWAEIKGLRNRIAHDYDGTNKVAMWQIINEDIPILHEQISNIIKTIK